jgi:REP element-mobilizing transposase RayT
MSRSKIPLEPNKTYHLFTHAIEGNNLFLKPHHYMHFLEKWEKLTSSVLTTYAYCLMPNHLHLCIKTGGEEIIPVEKDKRKFFSKKVGNVLSSYAQWFNYWQQHFGALFRSRFGRIEVMDDAYFKNLICYIHHNPIHHFNQDMYEDYRFSSYNTYKHYSLLNEYESVNNFIKPENYDYVINAFNGKQAFQDFHEAYKNEKRHLLIEAQIEAHLLENEKMAFASKFKI